MDMKKTLFCLCVLLASAIASQAQIAHWLAPLKFDKVMREDGMGMFLCKYGNTTDMWNNKGRQVGNTLEDVVAFHEKKGITLKPGTDIISGFFDLGGNKFVTLSKCRVAHNYPYFSEGYLLVRNGSMYCFLNDNGSLVFEIYDQCMPFQQGYAAGSYYESFKNKKGPYWVYTSTSGEFMPVSLNGQKLAKGEMEYASSFNDKGNSIVVTGGKVYYCDKNSWQLRPVIEGEDVTAGPDVISQMKSEGDNRVIFTAQSNSGPVVFTLSNLHVPISVEHNGNTEKFTNAFDEKPLVTNLAIDGKSSHKGLLFKGNPLLPPQFDELQIEKENSVLAKIGDKWGVLGVDPDEKLKVTMNDGKDMAFRHETFETVIRVDMPSYIPPGNTELVVDDHLKIKVDEASTVTNKTINGNYAEFKCELPFPEQLPDKPVELVYPIQVRYDGILSPVIPVSVKAWHLKYYNVNITDIRNAGSQVTFTINITKEENQPGETDYPFTVSVDAGKAKAALEKNSEIRYRCTLSSYSNGTTVRVKIHEQGCPPAIFPFVVSHSRPAASSKGKPSNSQVKIQKKESAPSVSRIVL